MFRESSLLWLELWPPAYDYAHKHPLPREKASHQVRDSSCQRTSSPFLLSFSVLFPLSLALISFFFCISLLSSAPTPLVPFPCHSRQCYISLFCLCQLITHFPPFSLSLFLLLSLPLSSFCLNLISSLCPGQRHTAHFNCEDSL